MKSHFLMLGLAASLLAACDKGAGSDSASNVASDGNTASSLTGNRAAPEQFLAPFLRDDVDACFGEAELETVSLKGRSEEQPAGSRPPARVVVLVDGSGSMAGRIGGRTKLELAREAAQAFVDSLPASTEVSLLAFGQQGDNSQAGKALSCSAVDTLVPATRQRDSVGEAVGKLRAVGWTPLAAGLAAAERTLPDTAAPGEQVIYVVSDGEETCGGDPVATARRINGHGRRAVVNIIGFGLPARDEAALRRVASAGGGSFVNITSETAAQRTFAQVREANRKSFNAVRVASASTYNATRTASVLRDAATCTSGIIREESTRVSRELTTRAVKGDPLPYADEVRAALDARHDMIRAREHAFNARLTEANERRQADTKQAAEGVR